MQTGGRRGSAAEHPRRLVKAEPVEARRKCHCGCGGPVTHVGLANDVALSSGCELSMRRWLRDGHLMPPKSQTGRARARLY